MKRVRLTALILAILMITQFLASCTQPTEDGSKNSEDVVKALPDEEVGYEVKEISNDSSQDDEDEDDDDNEDDIIETSGVLNDLNHTEFPVAIPTEGMKQFGAEGYGFITLPDVWIDHSEDYVDFEYNAIALGDPSGINSITLAYIDDLGSTIAVENMLDQVVMHMESRNGENITYDVTSLNGIEAHGIYCLFPDSFTGLMVWTFVVEDGYIHNIFAEGSMLMLLDMVVYIEASYTYE